MGRGRRTERGLTYVEVLATTTILAILAMAILPTAKASHQRMKEIELRQALRALRSAIDDFKMHCDPASPLPPDRKIAPRDPPYPARLEELVEGVPRLNQPPEKKAKFMRRIPIDPMTGNADWDLRCLEDAHDATSWCGKNVYDVRSKSADKALDGRTRYRDW